METSPFPCPNSSSCATAPEQNNCHRATDALDAQFSSFSFPAKKVNEVQGAKASHLKKLDQSLCNQQNDMIKSELAHPLNKPYRSMSAPGVFPLKRRQSNSPLRKISYTEETLGESCTVPELYSNITASSSETSSPLWSPSVCRSSIDYPDHKPPYQHARRTSSPGTFTLKHGRRPSPLGIGSLSSLSSSSSISSFESSYCSDSTEPTHYGSESYGPVKDSSRPASHTPRAASLDEAHLENSEEWKTWRAHHPFTQSRPPLLGTSRSAGSFSLKHHARPSPLGIHLPFSVTSAAKNTPLQTIIDESSSSAKK